MKNKHNCVQIFAEYLQQAEHYIRHLTIIFTIVLQGK